MAENSTIGQLVRKRRMDKHMTLERVSDLSGVSPSYLARCERGERFPSGRILRKLASPLEFTETELLKKAGYLSFDDSDVRFQDLKRGLKRAIAHALVSLYQAIDNL